jgi:hypothetical protein
VATTIYTYLYHKKTQTLNPKPYNCSTAQGTGHRGAQGTGHRGAQGTGHYYPLQLALHNYTTTTTTTTTTTAHNFNEVLAAHFLNPKGATHMNNKEIAF